MSSRPVTLLEGDKLLTFVGKADTIVDLQNANGLVSSERDQIVDFASPKHTFFEAVVGAASPPDHIHQHEEAISQEEPKAHVFPHLKDPEQRSFKKSGRLM